MIDSPVYPGGAAAAARRSRAGRLPGQRPAGHARRLGPSARARGVPRRRAGGRRVDRRTAARRARRRPIESCASSTSEHYVVRPAAAVARIAAGAAGSGPAARSARAGAPSSSCTRPAGTRPTGWRSGCRGARFSSAATTSRPSSCRRSRPAGRRRPTRRRSPGSRGWWRGPSGSSPVTAGRSRGERAAEVLVEDRSYLDALVRDRDDAALPDGRRTAAQRRLHADNVSQL